MWKAFGFHTLIRELKLGDKILILCLLLLAVVCGFILMSARGLAKFCIISVDGKDTYKLLLSDPQIIKVNGALGESLIEIRDAKVRMVDSPCGLKICVKQGEICSPVETIICIPNRVMVRISPTEVGIDAITW